MAQEPVKTAMRTLELFEVFAHVRRPLTLTELATRIATPISSCHALVRTLQRQGYVYVLDERKQVYPTKRLYTIADEIARHDPIVDQLSPIMNGLMRVTGDTVILGKRQANYVTYLEVVEGNQTLRYAATPGDTKPLHSSAIGKAMLGALSEAELDLLLENLPLEQITARTISDAAALKANLALGRERGYFITCGENVPDVMAISVVARIATEPYGLAVAGPITRLEAQLPALADALAEARGKIKDTDAKLQGERLVGRGRGGG